VQPLLERPPLATAGAFGALGLALVLLARSFRRRRQAPRASFPLNRAD
jgi:MYXO-CTERM domain-containing protein